MINLIGPDPLSVDVLVATLGVRYGWVLTFAFLIAVAQSRSGRRSDRQRLTSVLNAQAYWQHLPVLCWAWVTARQHIDFFSMCAQTHGPSVEMYWITAYKGMFALCCVCAVQILGLSMAGDSAASLGATGSRRFAMTGALLAVTIDSVFFLWAISPHRGVQFF